MVEHVSISGSTVVTTTTTATPTTGILLAGIPLTVATGAPPVTTTTTGNTAFGTLARPGVVGSETRYFLAAIPSGTVKFGYDIIDMMSIWLGYSGMYISSVARAADQTNPGGMQHSSFWAQGGNLGMNVRF